MMFRVFLLLLTLFAGTAAAGASDGRFLEGLRARRLYRLAERYCNERLRRSDLPHARRAELTIELSRTYADHALQSPPRERAARWDAAHRAINEFRRQFPDSPRLLLARLQDALAWLAEGELARQEAQVLAGRADSFNAARDALRKAARELEEISDAVEVALRRRLRRRTPKPDELTAGELASLEKNVAYQLARVYRNQAQSYPPDSPDRTNSLTRALEKLTPLAQLAVADDMVWRARVERVVCYRLLSDARRATQALAALVEAGPPPAIALRAQAEKIRLLLDADELAAALEAVAQGRAIDGRSSPELDLAHLEAQIAAWKAAGARGEAERAEHWQRQATAQVRLIEREHGPYWMRRGEMLLGRSVAGGAGSGVETLARAAASLYRGGRINEALAAYDRAVEQAGKEGAGDRAFDLAFTAAAIEHQRKNHAEAARRFERLARKQRSHARAGETHLLAILNLAELARDASPGERSERLARYERALEEHLTLWPRDPSSDQARLWLGDLRRSRRDWKAAADAYGNVAPGEHYETAVRALADCYGRWLDELKASGGRHPAGPAGEVAPEDRVAAEAVARLRAVVAPSGQNLPTRFSPLDRFCALAAAKIELEHRPQNAASAERALAAALDRSPDAPPAWRSEAAALLAFSLALQGRHDAAANVMDQISGGGLDTLVTMLAELTKLSATAAPAARRSLAELQLRFVALLEPRQDELRGDALRAFETGRAAALAAAGKTDAARRAYDQLAKKYPRDGDIQQARARLMARTNDPAALRAALAQWREIESKSRPGGARWFEARYAQAETYFRLGEAEQAAKLVKLTQVLHPALGGEALKAQFERLLERCQANDE